jgi:DNA-binding NarL/FixJ family response regulator
MTPADSFIEAVQAAEPGITTTEIAKRLGMARTTVSSRKFSVPRAVKTWNAAGWPALRYVPARVQKKPPSPQD